MNGAIAFLNVWGHVFCDASRAMLIQSGALILALLLIDALLKKRLRPSLRYGIWMLAIVKLVLPPTLALPSGIGYWVARPAAQISIAAKPDQNNFTSQISNFKFSKPRRDAVSTISDFNYQNQRRNADATTSFNSQSAMAGHRLERDGMLFAGWMAIVTALCALLIRRVLEESALLRQTDAASPAQQQALERCRTEIGLRGRVELRLTHCLCSPAACGILRPRILLPAELAATLSDDKLRAILLHELNHIRRGDLWANFAQSLLQIVYFYNPFVWLANARIRRVREQAVDEAVLAQLQRDEARTYSNTLLDLAQIALPAPAFSLRLIGVIESKSKLEERIRLMMHRPISENAKLGFKGLLIVLALGCVALPMAAAQIASPSPTPAIAPAPPELRAEIDRQRDLNTKNYLKAWNAGDLDGVLKECDDNALMLMDRQDIVIGKGKMTVQTNDGLKGGGKLRNYKNAPDHIWVSGDLIYDIGNFQVSVTRPTATSLLQTAFRNYLAIARRMPDGSLKIIVDAENPGQVPPEDEAAALPKPPVMLTVGGAGSPKLDDVAIKQIREREQAFNQKIKDGNYAAAAELFAKDAIMVPFDDPIVRGREAILGYIQKKFEGIRVTKIDSEPVSSGGNGDLAYLVTQLKWTVETDSQSMNLEGKGVTVWIREADGWKMLADLMNSNGDPTTASGAKDLPKP